LLKAIRQPAGAEFRVSATVSELPVYLDNHSFIRLAKGDPSRRRRFVRALRSGVDVLFSVSNAVEIIGPECESTTQPLRMFLDEIGPHWFPIELDAFEATRREAGGVGSFEAYFSLKFIKDFLAAQKQFAARLPTDGRFELSTIMDWLQPQRSSIRAGLEELDAALITKIGGYWTEFNQDRNWLDAHFPARPLVSSGPCRFAYDNMVRGLVLDWKGFRLKKGDGIDFCHAVAASALGRFATLDKHWKRRVEAFPQPNGLARIYHPNQIDQLVDDIEAYLSTVASRR
jgi:hypothetical protein